MSRRSLATLTSALALAVLPAAAARGETTEGPCVPSDPRSPICTFWEGDVARVDDGDTLRVRIDGEEGPPAHIRITGIQAMELSVHGRLFRAGDCHAIEATQRLEQLVEASGGRVRLSAIDETSESRERPRRSVAVRIGSRWADVGRILLREGLAIWLPGRDEWAWNGRYSTYAEQAAAARVGIWSPQSCGYGPSEGHPIKLWVNGDADGADNEDLTSAQGEWVRIQNRDPAVPLDLSRWWLRDSDLRQYTFPEGTVVAPGTTLTVHVGYGTDTLTDRFWGYGRPVFDNVRRDRELGDGAYLFDPQGDLRAWMTYPCRLSCADPNAGALELTVRPSGREQIGVRNVGASPVGLEDYRIVTKWHAYAFAPGHGLNPGETLRLVVRRDPARDQPLVKGWGKRVSVLPNRGGAVRLTTFRGAVLACVSWGDAAC